MIVLTRAMGQGIVIYDNIVLTPIKISGDEITFSILSPAGASIEVQPLCCVNRPQAHWPLKPVIEPAWLTWRDGVVVKIAKEIRWRKRFKDMPILADALEEAGCQDIALLDHFRSKAGHDKKCWVLDLLLPPRRQKKKVPLGRQYWEPC